MCSRRLMHRLLEDCWVLCSFAAFLMPRSLSGVLVFQHEGLRTGGLEHTFPLLLWVQKCPHFSSLATVVLIFLLFRKQDKNVMKNDQWFMFNPQADCYLGAAVDMSHVVILPSSLFQDSLADFSACSLTSLGTISSLPYSLHQPT